VSDWYIYQQSGEPVGPLPTEAIAQGLVDGKVGRDAFVAAEGDTQWHPITKVAELVTAARRLQQVQAQAPQARRAAIIHTVPPAPPPPAHAAPPVRVPKLPAMTIAVYPAPPPAEAAAPPPPASTRSVPPPRTTSAPPALAANPGDAPTAAPSPAVEPASAIVAGPPLPAVQGPPLIAAQPAADKELLYVVLAVAGFGTLLAVAAVAVGLWLFVW